MLPALSAISRAWRRNASGQVQAGCACCTPCLCEPPDPAPQYRLADYQDGDLPSCLGDCPPGQLGGPWSGVLGLYGGAGPVFEPGSEPLAECPFWGFHFSSSNPGEIAGCRFEVAWMGKVRQADQRCAWTLLVIAANCLVWYGSKATGHDPAGLYHRHDGTATVSALLVELVP